MSNSCTYTVLTVVTLKFSFEPIWIHVNIHSVLTYLCLLNFPFAPVVQIHAKLRKLNLNSTNSRRKSALRALVLLLRL
jgi:hypothetical protein